MHCPQCGQQQISDETRFCSRCGFLLTGISEVVANGGVVPSKPPGLMGTIDSPRRRGVKVGLFWALLSFIVVPLMAMLSIALDIPPYLVVGSVFLFAGGGILRMVYALMFESGVSGVSMQTAMPAPENRAALPPTQSIPVSAYTSPAGAWRDTNELQHTPGSVTDSTTKLLQKEDQ